MISYKIPILIPAGCEGHAVTVCVEKISEKMGRLILYNTGGGLIKHHPQWKETNRYQTYFIIEDVPLEDLYEVEQWQTLLNFTSAKNMDPVYAHFRKMGRNGRPTPPSLNEEDYEQKQMSETCSSQNLMAAIRHQLMHQLEGSQKEKLALYHFFKAQLIRQMSQSSLNKVDSKIQNLAKMKLEKQEALLTIAHIAENKESFDMTLTKLCDALTRLGAQTFVETIQKVEINSFLARLSALELCSKELVKLWMKQPIDFPPSGEEFLLATKLYENQKLLYNSITQFLHACHQDQKFEALGFHLGHFLLNSRFTEEIREIVLTHLCPLSFSDLNQENQRKGLDTFIKALKPFPNGKQYLQNLAIFLSRSRQQTEISNYILQEIEPQEIKSKDRI